MKISVMGVKLVAGLSKESQQPFEISRLLCMVPIESGKFKSVTITGHGYELAEMELDPASIHMFSNVKFPASLELITEQCFYRGKFETIVTAFNKDMAKVA